MHRVHLQIGAVLAAWLLSSACLLAHDPGLSSIDVTIGPSEITVAFVLNGRDWVSTGIDTAAALRSECVGLTVNSKSLLPGRSSGPTPDGSENVNCELSFPRAASGQLTIHSLLFDRLPFGHREFIKVHDGAGHVLLEAMLHRGSESCEVVLAPEPPAPAPQPANSTWLSFISLGMQHILTGSDHMLFLAGLLLVCTGFRQAAGVITWFTIAHSLTLALSVLNLVVLPSKLVEAAVAASIIFVGVENLLRPTRLKLRGRLAFCFGLVHGLGFASVLRAMGIGSGGTGIAVPLLSFNAGVELGQLALALAVLPIILLLREQPGFRRHGTPGLSLVIVILGAFWFVQRVTMA